MAGIRQLFLDHLAQTTDFPLAIEMERAEGCTIWGGDGKAYLDLISGISVSNIGHRNPEVVQAIKDQVDKHMHLLVYGEFIQSPQAKLAALLAESLGHGLDQAYLVNSGSEAVEGALKLAKRYTGRTEIVAFNDAYHGSTQGALSVIGSEEMRRAYRPLIPGIRHIAFNNPDEFRYITTKTAAVIVEPIQGEAGYISPDPGFLKTLCQRCTQMGALVIFDEVQTGFGRSGDLFAFQAEDAVPDIITLAKGMGGGMPIGAFVSRKEIMSVLKENPMLGHITTFGGHPVSCAAALASLEVIRRDELHLCAREIEALYRKHLKHPDILEIRGRGAMLAVQLDSFDRVQKVIEHSLKNGIITDWFLFNTNSLRIAPPLIISEEEIIQSCVVIIEGLDS